MAKLAFRPDADGFLFSNSFTWDVAERAALSAISTTITPAVISSLVIPDPILVAAATAAAALYLSLPATPLPNANGYGLCGGMCYAALDYWHAHMILPRGAHADDEPLRGSAGEPVRGYIWNRLIDSLTTGGVLSKTVEWMLRLNVIPGFLGGGAGWLNDRTAEEWEAVKRKIDQGQPCPIGLVGDTPSAWDQHQILAYGYDDSSTIKRLFVYDPNDPHDYGTMNDTVYTFSFSPSGLNVFAQPSTGIGTLKGFFCSQYVFASPPVGLAPAYGQFVTVDNASGFQVWMMADGERFPVANLSELTALGGAFADVRTHQAFPLNAVAWPRDGAILRELSHPEVFIIQGGARFHIPNPSVMDQFGGFEFVHVVPDGTLQQFQRLPSDDTLLREISDPKVFLIHNGVKQWVRTPADLLPLGGFASVRVVPDGALAGILEGLTIPPQLGSLIVSVQPYPVPLARAVTVTVAAHDSATQAPVAGTVLISHFRTNGQPTQLQCATNTAQVMTLHSHTESHYDPQTGDLDIEELFPVGIVSAAGYESIQIDMGYL